jgi:tryptophan synthase alpha chain
MNRIDSIFQDLRADGGKALMPYITAGDPSVEATGGMLSAIQSAGASICELGIPFSDPIADGPVIQASMTYALDHGVTVGQVFEMVAGVRPSLSIGLVAMVSFSIVHRIGLKKFVSDAKDAGFDGFIFPDLPLEASGPAREAAARAGLILSMLIAPTTPDDRAERIARASTGFVYVVSRSGITGERAELPPQLPGRLRRLRGVTDLPITVGFGISTAQHVRQVVSVADAAIVGSGMMRRIAEARLDGGDRCVKMVEDFTRELASGLGPAQGASVRG